METTAYPPSRDLCQVFNFVGIDSVVTSLRYFRGLGHGPTFFIGASGVLLAVHGAASHALRSALLHSPVSIAIRLG